MKKKHSGMTLIEMLVVLAIAGLISVAGLLLFSVASEKQKVVHELRRIAAITSAVQSLYAGTNNQDFSGLTPEAIVASGSIPESMYNNSGTGPLFQSMWGTMIVGADADTLNRSYSITYENLPPKVCMSLIASGGGGFELIMIDNIPTAGIEAAVSQCESATAVRFLKVSPSALSTMYTTDPDAL